MTHHYAWVQRTTCWGGGNDTLLQTTYKCMLCDKTIIVMGLTPPNELDNTFCPVSNIFNSYNPMGVFVCSHGFQHQECPTCINDDCRCETCVPPIPFIDF